MKELLYKMRGLVSMYEIDHGVNLESVRINELIKLMKLLTNINQNLKSLEDYNNSLDSLGMGIKFVSDLHFNNLKAERTLKKHKLFILERIKYLKRTDFDFKFSFSKNRQTIYVLGNGRMFNNPDVPRIKLSSDLSEEYIKYLTEANILYLLLDAPEWIGHLEEDENQRNNVEDLLNKLKRAIAKYTNFEDKG